MNVESISSTNFRAIRGRHSQNYTIKQQMLIEKLEESFNKPINKNKKSSYMNEMDKRNIDLYIKPSINEDEIKVTLFKKKGKSDIKRIRSLGFLNVNSISGAPERALNIVKEQDDKVKPIHVLAMMAVIAGLTSLIYLLPNRGAKNAVQKTIDTVMVQKATTDSIVKDSLKIF